MIDIIDKSEKSKESSILEKLETISESILRVDMRIHNQYTNKDLSDVQKDIKAYETQALLAYNKYVDSRHSEQNTNEYEKISIQCEKIRKELEERDNKNKNKINSCFDELLKLYNKLNYSFQTANLELKDIRFPSSNMNMILLCKNVRTMEDLINKICSNNIDKSIIGGEKHFDSMRHGFAWLFCHNDVNRSSSYQRIDIRDRNRYLDYIKYQIMVASKYVEFSPKTSDEIDYFYEKIQQAFDNKPFSIKVKSITRFKEEVIQLIDIFFHVYETLTKYRDALFQEEEIRKNVNIDAEAPVIPSDVVRLSAVAVRVLLDRFVSFVKINDLNFGNSTFNRSWFNYSELSNSNYAGSNFKNARIENAKVKNCDISTSNLSLADGSGTDFSNSNFDYSNLTGINLDNATINNCQFNRALFRDTNLDTYKNAIKEHYLSELREIVENDDSTKEEKTYAIRILTLFDCWGASSFNSDSIKKIKNIYQSIKLPEINVSDDMPSVSILSCQINENDIIQNTKDFIKRRLGSHISSELLSYVRECLTNESREEQLDREERYGKILLDIANLTSVSAKGSQMKETDFCHIDMQKASFENSDLSASTLYYTCAEFVSFIYSNLNDIRCFESDFFASNFSNSVMNNSQFANCNLNGTNWNKSILIGSTFIDVSDCMDAIINNNSNLSMSLQLKSCFDSSPDETLIKDTVKTIEQTSYETNKFWQKNCAINDSTFKNVLADNTDFINIIASRSSFNDASLKNSFIANCRMHLTDFIHSDLRYAYLVCSSMSQSNFSYANMTMSKIHYVDFCNANLSNALLNISELNHVLFVSSNLEGINLSGSTIKNCAFKDCRFENVILAGAVFENCLFENVKFVNNIGRSSCKFINCYPYLCKDKDGKELTSLDNLKTN